ncbi:hypothetical protein IFM62136_06196 [Aspergillus lentulus]|nr:hypothetical protein IFM62136_06196 [Aspergillus lentulus]
MDTRKADAKSKSKRIITPARRDQNRRAQRAYRQRRRELLAEKQGQAGSKDLRPAPAPIPDDTPTKSLHIARKTLPAMLTVDHFFLPCNPSSKSNTEETARDEIPPPLFTTYTLLLTACVYNAAALGISVDQFSSYNCMSLCSPFYRPYTAMSADPSSLLAAATVTRPAIPVHLRPTLPQILFPHHPLFDLLPLPALRAKAITFAATAPSLLDAVEFKRDIVERGGIVCSSESVGGGSGGYSLSLRTSRRPWNKTRINAILAEMATSLQLHPVITPHSSSQDTYRRDIDSSCSSPPIVPWGTNRVISAELRLQALLRLNSKLTLPEPGLMYTIALTACKFTHDKASSNMEAYKTSSSPPRLHRQGWRPRIWAGDLDDNLVAVVHREQERFVEVSFQLDNAHAFCSIAEERGSLMTEVLEIELDETLLELGYLVD